MFVGHGALAFAIVGLVALYSGVERERATALAIVAGLFATVPDVDMVYALTGLAGVPLGGPLTLAESFWSASTVVHRSMTHSLVIAVPAIVAFTLAGRSRVGSGLAVLVGGGIVVLAGTVSGPITALVGAAFVVAGLLVGWGAARYGLSPAAVATTALVGLVTHPFGDLLTGQPPDLLYPFAATVLDGRVLVSTDPTLHLLGAFGLELATIWLAIFTLGTLRGTRLRTYVRPRATLGAAYATAVLFLPAPTVDGSYLFVFSVLAVGIVGVVPLRRRLPSGLTAVTTGLAGVTVAGVAYLVAYVMLDAAPLLAQASQAF